MGRSRLEWGGWGIFRGRLERGEWGQKWQVEDVVHRLPGSGLAWRGSGLGAVQGQGPALSRHVGPVAVRGLRARGGMWAQSRGQWPRGEIHLLLTGGDCAGEGLRAPPWRDLAVNTSDDV